MSAAALGTTVPPRETDGERSRAYVHGGQSFVAAEPTIVTTILGSCVSVCFFDAAAEIGGITHYVLPRPLMGAAMPPPKIGTVAIPQLFESLVAIGASPARLCAKVFGGASMHAASRGTARDLGHQNALVAMEVLARLSICVVASDTGGAHGRKLVFHTDDGSAWIKYLEGR